MYQWLKRLVSSSPAVPAETVHAPVPAPPPAPVAASSAPIAAGPVRSVLQFEQKDNVNANYYHWLFDTQDEDELDTNPAEVQVLEGLQTILKSQQSGAALVRRMPGLIPQLLQSLRSDTFSGAALSKTISGDVVLVAAVTRLANSYMLGNGKSITSVEHAIIVIGQEGLRQLITSVAFRPIIDVNSGAFTRLLAPRIWDQSERCALANRVLAASMGVDPFEAFLAGLVQYVGLIVALRMMDQASKDGKDLGSAMFTSSLLRDARSLAVSIGREWNFPESVVQGIAEQGSMRKGAIMSPMGQLLSLSDYLSKVRILVDADRLAKGDPRVFKGLTPEALACFARLDAPEEVGA